MQNPKVRKKINPWPFALAGFLGAFFLYLVGFVIFSTFHSLDLVAENYYDQEVDYQQQIDREKRSRGVLPLVRVNPDPIRKILSVSLAQGVSEQVTKGTIHFYRPSDARLDFEVALREDSGAIQFIDTADLKPGLWKIKLIWESAGEEYYFEDTVVL